MFCYALLFVAIVVGFVSVLIQDSIRLVGLGWLGKMWDLIPFSVLYIWLGLNLAEISCGQEVSCFTQVTQTMSYTLIYVHII